MQGCLFGFSVGNPAGGVLTPEVVGCLCGFSVGNPAGGVLTPEVVGCAEGGVGSREPRGAGWGEGPAAARHSSHNAPAQGSTPEPEGCPLGFSVGNPPAEWGTLQVRTNSAFEGLTPEMQGCRVGILVGKPAGEGLTP